MPKNLVIVESPAKAHTIEKYLGKDFHVLASVGHIRKDTKVDKATFDVTYEVDPDHRKSSLNYKKPPPLPTPSGWRPMKTAKVKRFLGTSSKS